MMTSTFRRNRERAQRLKSGIRHIDIREALTGTASGTLNDANVQQPYMYIRDGEARRQTRALNLRINPGFAHIPINVGINARTGELEVIEIHPTKGPAVLGERAASAGALQVDPAMNNTPIPAYNFMPGQIYSPGGNLELAARSFPYIATDGTEQVWNSSDTVDVSGDVPGANLQVLVRISLNPDPDNPGLVATAGATQSTLIPFQRGDATAISIPAGHISLCVVRLVNADTSLTLKRYWDWRFFASEGPEQSDEIATFPRTITNQKTIPTGRAALWYGDITISGDGNLTINGDLRITT